MLTTIFGWMVGRQWTVLSFGLVTHSLSISKLKASTSLVGPETIEMLSPWKFSQLYSVRASPCEASSETDSTFDMTTYDAIHQIPWLIVGGGIHGVHIATRLLGKGPVEKKDICIIDDNPELLHKWKTRTAATGMTYLRSSAGYHLDLEEHSLRHQYGSTPKDYNRPKKKKRRKQKQKKRKQQNDNIFSNDYERPRLDIFNHHCDKVIDKYQLNDIHLQGTVIGIEPHDDHVRVVVAPMKSEMSKKVMYIVENVVLALGNDCPSYPDWVHSDDVKEGLISHLLDENVNRDAIDSRKSLEGIASPSASNTSRKVNSVAVIGGGISAAHKVLEMVRKRNHAVNNDGDNTYNGSIRLLCRHSLREQQFDTHQDWMMDEAACKRSLESGGYGKPSRQRAFSLTSCMTERRQIIQKERIPGTITPEINRGKNGLRYAIADGDVIWSQAEVLSCTRHTLVIDNGFHCTTLELELSNGEKVNVDKVLLATGFGKGLPGGNLIKSDLVEQAGLMVSRDGFPIVDENLSWHQRIYVAGALAELELGPSARNIAGARLAAERITSALI